MVLKKKKFNKILLLYHLRVYTSTKCMIMFKLSEYRLKLDKFLVLYFCELHL